MNRLPRVAVLLVSVTVGYLAAIALSGPSGVDPSPTPAPGERSVAQSTTTTTSFESPPTAAPGPTTYLVWTSGGLPDELVSRLNSGFAVSSIVGGDMAPLDVEGGRVVPLDALAIEVEDHAPFDPTGDTTRLVPGTVLLGETSAGYRGARVGDMLSIAGHGFRVVGIVPDDVVGAAEVVFAKSDPNSPVEVERFALVQSDLPRSDFETIVRGMHEGPTPLRIRAEGETPWLRHGDAVLPQIFIKLALGEFSYTPGGGSEVIQDPEFVAENIVTATVPVLGRVECHRVVVEMLSGAMSQLVEEGLSSLVDPDEFAGCWNPRFIRTVTGSPAGLSRHSWGAALDINATSNGLGSSGTQDPRLIEIMSDWGFIWGGDWAVPDPMHFEYGIPPAGS